MIQPQFCFFRGSTPAVELLLPMDCTAQDVLYATFSQGDRTVVEYAQNGQPDRPGTGTMETEGRLVRLQMSQQDTLAFDCGDCELQLRIKTEDGADTFFPLWGIVGPVRKEGLI